MNPFNVKKGILIPTSMLPLLSGEDQWEKLRKSIVIELSNVTSFSELVVKLEEANKAVDILIYDMNLIMPVQKPLKALDTGEAKFNLKKVMLGESKPHIEKALIGDTSPLPQKVKKEETVEEWEEEKMATKIANNIIPTEEKYKAKVRLFIKKGIFNYYYHPEYFIGSVQAQKSEENQFALFHKKLGQLTTWGTAEALMRDIIEEGVTFD